MQAALLGLAGPPLAARPLAGGRRRPSRLYAAGVTSEGEGMSWLTQQAAEVEAASEAEAVASAAAASDDSKASSVGLGLHIRGRTAFREGATDEDDPARFFFHRALRQAAVKGAFGTAEQVVEEMAASGYVPGPRAYHALVLSHVKARDAAGALGAIRRCWDAGITPLAETYAAVVAAHVAEGDLDTAEAVCASNRRAGVDCSKSWQQLVAALLQAGQRDRAMEMLGQGEAEGLLPSEDVYAALIAQMCGQGDLQEGMQLLESMLERELKPGLEHYQPLITAYAAQDNTTAAVLLLDALLSTNTFSAGMIAVCDAVLEAQMRTCASSEEAGGYLRAMKAVLLGHRVQPGRRFFAAQMSAALRLHDPQSAMHAFRALRGGAVGPLQGLSDDMLGQLLLELSAAHQPAELYEVLASMSRNGRPMPAAAMAPDERGCSVLGAWVQQRLDEAQAQQPVYAGDGGAPAAPPPRPRAATITIDGVSVDPLLLSVVDEGGMPAAVSRMGVKELRAELAARRAPVAGNKKDLVKRVQRLRLLDGTRSNASAAMQKLRAKDDKSSRVSVVVCDDDWGGGQVVQEARYESEKEAAALAEEEGAAAGATAGEEWDMGEEEEAPAARRSGVEEELFDDEEEEAQEASAVPEQRLVLQALPAFTSPLAGPHEAAQMLLGAAVDLRAVPTAADVAAVAAYVLAAGDVPAAVLLAAALDRVPGGVEGGEAVRAAAVELCQQHSVDLEAAIEGVLWERDDGAEGEILGELQGLLQEIA